MGAAPLLRWAGSKQRLLPQLLLKVPRKFGRYIEPFAGSAAFFWALRPKKATLSDINSELINFFERVRLEPEALHGALQSIPDSKNAYYEVRSALSGIVEPTERAVAFWYLNRRCFNGLYRTNRNGGFNVPYGSKIPPIPSLETTRAWSGKLKTVRVVCSDFEKIVDSAERGDFAYIDPPYLRHSKRDRGEYGIGALKDNEMDRLLAAVRRADKKGVRVLISYNASLERELPRWNHCSISNRFLISADPSKREKITETACWNYALGKAT